MISCKQIATLAQSAREAIAAGEKWMRIEEDCLAILELANLATIGLVTKQQAEHAGVEPPHCYAFKTCSSPAICAKAGHCVNTFDAQQQAEPVGDDEGEAFSAAMKIARDLGNHASYAYVWNAALQHAAQSGQRAGVAEGWKLVPIEPTPQMRKAAADAWLDCDSRMILNKAAAALRAAIAAAPTPAAQGGDSTQDVIGYINHQTATILRQGQTVCTHISPHKTEYASVPLVAGDEQ